MSTEGILDVIAVPRANGSEGLRVVASFIEESLRQVAPVVELHEFSAPAFGFQLLFGAVLLLVAGFVVAVLRDRHGFALVLMVLAIAALVVETELMASPISGLLPVTERNILATYPGPAHGPLLILAAHYDSATQFGDHFTWNRWGPAIGPAGFLGALVAVAGLWRRAHGLTLGRRWLPLILTPVVLPFAVMAWCFTVGPVLRAPSSGALDNAGSVTVLIRLAESLAARPASAPTTVTLAFFASEEERAMGSWQYASTLGSRGAVAVINLETLGTREPIGYVPDEGFQLLRYEPSRDLVRLVNDSARDLSAPPVNPVVLPRAALTDARSFLARGIPALTLIGPIEGTLPRHLHSARDSRDRVDVAALDEAVGLLAAVVDRVDRNPGLLASVPLR